MGRLSVRLQQRWSPHFKCSRLKVLSDEDQVLMRKREKLCKRENLDFPKSAKPIICVVRVSGFADLFDLEHFIHSLKSDVRIVKQLPRNFDKREIRKLHSMVPVSWSSMAYYEQVLVPLLKQHKVNRPRIQPSQHFATSHAVAHPAYQLACAQVVYIHESDSRLANNSPRVPPELQKLRCRVQYRALRFSPALRSLSETIIRRLWARGPFLALHLRYEMDMLAFTGCSQGCTSEEERRITKLRCVAMTQTV